MRKKERERARKKKKKLVDPFDGDLNKVYRRVWDEEGNPHIFNGYDEIPQTKTELKKDPCELERNTEDIEKEAR